jgi:DNA-binding CsgD family transcriptional regulator
MRQIRPTPRQLQILMMRSRGRSISDIAGALGISPETVRTHEQMVLARLHAASMTHAVSICFRQGWLR